MGAHPYLISHCHKPVVTFAKQNKKLHLERADAQPLPENYSYSWNVERPRFVLTHSKDMSVKHSILSLSRVKKMPRDLVFRCPEHGTKNKHVTPGRKTYVLMGFKVSLVWIIVELV